MINRSYEIVFKGIVGYLIVASLNYLIFDGL